MKSLVLICFSTITVLAQAGVPVSPPGTAGAAVEQIAPPAQSTTDQGAPPPGAAAAPVVGNEAAPNTPVPQSAGSTAAQPSAAQPSAEQPTAAQPTAAQPTAPAKTPAVAPAKPAKPAREPGLYATIKTSMGDIVVKLFEKESPLAVANFVGLARGTKTWTDPATGKPTRRPLYSGTTFHRVIPDFMIQGGDPLGTGMGTPGYKFNNENTPGLNFDQKGRLAMANAGPNTNGSQFFITVAPYPSLNGGYTIFGQVLEGQDVADKISRVPRDPGDKPLTPVKIARIVIERVGPAPARKPPVHRRAPVKKAA